MVTAEQFAQFIKAKDANAPLVAESLAVSIVLIDDQLSNAYRPVPDNIRDWLVLEVGHGVYKRKDSASGSSPQIDYSSGQGVMGPRDPLQQVWPIIRRYVLPL